MEQIKQFEPGFTLGERAETIEKQEDGSFIVTSNEGSQFHSKVVAIAGGLGSFEPRKPLIEGINFENKESSISSKIQKNLNKKSIAGGGDCFRLEYFLDRCRFRGNIDSPS
jgi:thioredoxin reductase (NADPH)